MELETNTKHLFEDCAWLYAFCRERLFRDHTEEITQALFPEGILRKIRLLWRSDAVPDSMLAG